MLRATLRWTLILACLLAIGPGVQVVLGMARDADGGKAVTLLLTGTSGRSALGAGVAIAAAAAVGVVGAHGFSMGTGFLCAGIVLAWARWGMGTLDAIARRQPAGEFLPWLAVENVLVVAGVVALGALMVLLSLRRQSQRPPGSSHWGGLFVWGEGRRASAIGALLVGAVVCGGVTWVVAASELRGQTLMAVVCGTLAGAAGAQLIAASAHCVLTPAGVAAAMLIPALAGPIAAMTTSGGQVLDAVNQGTIPALARPISLDWAAGVLLGAPIGLGWAGAMLDERSRED
jgi:hypothetical protein